MTPELTEELPRAQDQELLLHFRERLRAVGYAEVAATGLEPASDRGDSGDRSPDRQRAARLLVDLFMVRVACERDLVQQALGDVPIEPLVSSALLEVEGERVRARFRLAATGDFFTVSDWFPTGRSSRPDLVVGVHPASEIALRLCVRTPVESALDIGTGTGIQALYASRHSREVVATDINRRALVMAEFNAALNEVENIEFLEGSWFEPVEGRKFDLIVSNPPFVISPADDFLYRDTGMEGDGASMVTLAGAAAHLARGGHAHVMCNWIAACESVTESAARVYNWVLDEDCDVLVIRHRTATAEAYARSWNSTLAESDPDGFAAAVRGWLAEFERLGISRIDSGLVTLRRKSGRCWRHGFETTKAPAGPAGEELLRMLAGRDIIDGAADDQDLTGLVLRLVNGSRIDQALTHEGGSYSSHPAVLRMRKGSGVRVELPARLLDAIFELDGTRTVGAILDEHAAADGTSGVGTTEELISAVTALLGAGLLEVVVPQASMTSSRLPNGSAV